MNRQWMIVFATAGLVGAAAAQQPATPPKTWADDIKFKGDLRYRFEQIDEQGKDTRQRDRIRARLGSEAKVNDNVTAAIQLSTTSGGDPVSGNQTLTDGGTKKGVYLDLAYVQWSLAEGLKVTGGKMKNAFLSVSDLIWDGDFNPEGLAAEGSFGLDDLTLSANGGYLWMAERSGESDDTRLYIGQGAAKYQFTPEWYLKVGGGYYAYDNLQGYDVIDYEKKNNAYGNSTTPKVKDGVTNKLYATEYKLVEGFAELGYWHKIPYTLYGHYVVNTEASENDTGWQAGLGIGKAKNPKTFEVGYAYAKVEKDAVVGAFTDSDRWGGGTDGQGHKLLARYQIGKNWQTGVTYFMNEKPIADASKKHDYDRIQVDFVAKF